MKNKKYAVLSLSGGMDSSSLLLHLLATGHEVTCLSFDYGQKHKVELERATSLVEYINKTCPKSESCFDGCKVKHQIITLDGLAQLLNSSLVEGGTDVPEGHYAEENMKATVVPNRNKIFASIIQAVALSIAEQNNAECTIAMGIHKGDDAIYPDCRGEFRDADFAAFKLGNWGSEKVTISTPFLEVMKYDILKHGSECCEQLGLDFDEIYKRTNTSYKPFPSGNSDYKSAASVERIEAFIRLGRPDPVKYEDETGEVTWEVAKAHVENILKQWENK
jgi:7-cyano-7-deazaguanine synthase